MSEKKDWSREIEENIRSGLTEVCLLSMLSQKDMYAYEMKIALNILTKGTFALGDGAMYGALNRLVARGIVTSYQTVVGEKRVRNYFHLEEAGKEYLKASVAAFNKITAATNKVINGFFEFPKEGEERVGQS